jgi:hypothetical protein
VTERAKINRPITPQEVAVIRYALERAPAGTLGPRVGDTLEHLRAIGHCGCGCDSIDFVPCDPSHMSQPIADGIGTTPAGGDVGVVVWGHLDAVTGLEIYSLGAEDHDLKLPLPGSIHPFVTQSLK